MICPLERFVVWRNLSTKMRRVVFAYSQRKYLSAEGSAFLRICGAGENLYVGKLVDDRVTTDQVKHIRGNVLSIIRKVGHEVRLLANLQILVCSSVGGDRLPPGGSHLE